MKQFRIVFFGGLLFTLAPIFWVDAQPPAQIDSKAFFRGISNNLHTHKSSKDVLASLAALEDLKDAMRNAHYNLISLMQHHPDPKVRIQATASLAAIAGPAHHTPFLVDNLMKVLDDKNVDVRAAGL